MPKARIYMSRVLLTSLLSILADGAKINIDKIRLYRCTVYHVYENQHVGFILTTHSIGLPAYI